MDLRDSPAFHSNHQQEGRGESNVISYKTKTEKNPFLDEAFEEDPLCKLNLKETCEFVKSFPKICTSSSSILFDNSSGVQRRREFNNGVNNYYSLSMKRNNVLEAGPPTPGRPIFSFSSTKGLPSKWEDAEKWLVSTTNYTHGRHHQYHDSPASASSSSAHYHHYYHHGLRPSPLLEFSATNSRLNNAVGFSNEGSYQADLLLLKDKFTNHEEADYNSHFFKTTNFKSSSSSEPMKQAFFFGNITAEKEKPIMKSAATDMGNEVKEKQKQQQQQQHRDIGTEMTPLGSSTTSRCPTPFMSTSPARYNTPENRSGPLVHITPQIEECHFAKLSNSNYYWSSREEEEEEISKSLRHFELNNNDDNDHSDDDECKEKKGSICENRSFGRKEEEKGEDDKTKCCLRFQSEEAKIQAWVNLQRAKAEAQSRKLEVKIEKMRSNLEDKLMKKMAVVHRKAEEMRTAYRIQHLEQAQKSNHNSSISSKNTPRMIITTDSYFTKPPPSNHSTCGCFPCTTINQFY